MEPVIVPLDERLAAPGDSRSLSGSLPSFSIQLGGHLFEFEDGLNYDIMLTNAGDGILASGIVRTEAHSACDRCLGEAILELAAELDEYYLFEETEKDDPADDEDEIDYLYVSDHSVDLTQALNNALVMELPFVVLCRDDCAGLCPVCGHNLNEGDCGHLSQLERQREEEQLRKSPFASLRSLSFDD